MAISSVAYIGIGSNIGDRLAFCQKAVSLLGTSDVAITAISSLYETAPVDYLHQDRFYNAVVEITTTLSPHLLLKHCQEIEHTLDKHIKIPKGPRTIDLDILFYQDTVISSQALVIPHPAALLRIFVLIPMAEIAPDFIPPGSHQKTIHAICEEIGSGAFFNQSDDTIIECHRLENVWKSMKAQSKKPTGIGNRH